MQLCAGGLYVLDDVGVCIHRGLLQIAHKPVHGLGVNDVHGHQGWSHDSLCRHNHKASEPRGLKLLQTQQQVHTLVLRLLQQGGDPAIVALQSAQRPEMSEPSSHEARHASYTLQDNETPLHSLHRWVVSLVSRDEIEDMVHGVHLNKEPGQRIEQSKGEEKDKSIMLIRTVLLTM